MAEKVENPKVPKSSSSPPAGTVIVRIEDEMRGAYLDYAMSVIIGRALPDVRDGLKPVHRRALYAMHDLGNVYNRPYKKSARIVGDVIGKYHPHGDTAVYDTIVRMAQDFSLRYTLVDGQGNFGSIDGDSAAAMRYTEVRMEKIAGEMLADLEKETVDFGPNYDESLKEPLVLPAAFPNLLVNGSAGIAVGMATNIPPHNLGEVIDAVVALIKNPKMETDDLLKFVKGPDFPTAGVIYGRSGIDKAYRTGRGIITVRGRAEIEIAKKNQERIVITELPYQVNKAKLIEKIADHVRNKRIEGISDLRDESDRDGIRLVIDVRRGENSNILLNRLYKLTSLQESFGISLLAIHHNQPKVFNLRDMLWAFIEHRKDVILRRTAFELRQAEAKAHILEGLKKAVENIDAVIKIIRGSQGPADAKASLVAEFSFSDRQSQAILDMRLQRLTGLEREKIVKDYNETLSLIKRLKSILGSEELVFDLITDEQMQIRKDYGDKRRTQIDLNTTAAEFEVEDLIADEETLVTLTHRGYIKRSGLSQFRSQSRGGKGIKGVANMADSDFPSAIYQTRTLSYILCFTNQGRVHSLKVYEIPEASRYSRGKAISNLVSLAGGHQIRAVQPIQGFEAPESVVMVTKKGVIKKTTLGEFSNAKKHGVVAIKVRAGDDLVGAKIARGNSEILLMTKNGQCIRFPEDNVRNMGRSAAGVAGINLGSGDEVVAMEVLDAATGVEILTVTEKGFGKRTPMEEYRIQRRGGTGIMAMKSADRNGSVVSCCQVRSKDQVMLVSNKGKMIRMKVEEISQLGRVTMGVRLMKVDPGEKIVALEHIVDMDAAAKKGNGAGSLPGQNQLH